MEHQLGIYDTDNEIMAVLLHIAKVFTQEPDNSRCSLWFYDFNQFDRIKDIITLNEHIFQKSFSAIHVYMNHMQIFKRDDLDLTLFNSEILWMYMSEIL